MRVHVGHFLQAHRDERRTLWEWNFPSSAVQSFLITSSMPLANHFHKEKQETFLLLEGEGSCTWLALYLDGSPQGMPETIQLEAGSLLQIFPFTAHAFRLKPGSRMICFSSVAFNPENKDMFPYQLEV
ncbi:MAG TPA: hypothetical protein VKR06_04465 [Ktedonosporobacter sp.]|nr:hypothetical protein [Ktedonosporobacter sp.]